MWNLPPGDTVLHLLSWVSLAALAMTAALAAGRRSVGAHRLDPRDGLRAQPEWRSLDAHDLCARAELPAARLRYRWNMPKFVYVGSKREYSGSATALHNANTVRTAPRRRTSARCSNGALRRDHQLARRPSAPPFRDLPLRGHNRKPAAVSRP
jgi:hypothetical protein